MKKSFCLAKTVHGAITTWDQLYENHFPDDYVRLTEYVEVDYPDLPADSIIATQLDQLQAMENEINLKAATALAEVQRRRQELLAITHAPSAG